MSAGGGTQAEGDLELNIAPIVDCFTVLIAYLLVTMSFISLGIIEAGVAATGPAPEQAVESPPPEVPLNVSVQINPENRIELKITGGAQHVDQTVMLEAKGAGYDFDGLKAKLDELKLTYAAELKDANVSADPSIRYKSIVKVIEAVKKEIPKVFLASS
jgi:biopolymer transport protein ExbD